jgi:hypothetical protein
MAGFADSIIGGATKLIRAAIQSPNYVPGVSGWSINKSGTAEFDTLIVRTTLIGLTITIPAGATTGARIIIDDTGIHAYNAANVLVWDLEDSGVFSLEQIVSSPLGSASIELGDLIQGIIATGPNARNVSFIGSIAGQTYDFIISDSGVARSTSNPDTYQFGAGTIGGVYYEEWLLATQSIPNGNALTTLAGMTLAHSYKDFATALVVGTGVWTAPCDGEYTFTVGVHWQAPGAGASELQFQNAGGTTSYGADDRATTSGNRLTTITRFFAAGSTVIMRLAQGTTGARSINGGGDQASFISIRRALT